MTVEKWLDDGGVRIDGPATVEPGIYTVNWMIRPRGRAVDVFTMSDLTIQGVPVDLSTLSCVNNYNQVVAFDPDPSDPGGAVIVDPALRFVTANDWALCEAQLTLADGDVHSDQVTVTAIANGSGILAQNPPYTFTSPVLTVDAPGYDPGTGSGDGDPGTGGDPGTDDGDGPGGDALPAGATLPATGLAPWGPAALATGSLLAGLLLGWVARRRSRIS